MVKAKFYIFFGLIVFLGLLTLTGCGGGKGYDYIKNIDGSGSWYAGELKNGKPHGEGSYYYGKGDKKGDEYKGEFKNGQPYGQGTYTWANGDKYVGEFKNGQPHGEGKWTHTKEKSSIPSSGTSKSSCGHDSCAEEGPFLCMGKNDTCTNTTGCAYVFYCNSCR